MNVLADGKIPVSFLMIVLLLVQCSSNQNVMSMSNNSSNEEDNSFLFVDLSKIYSQNKSLLVLSENKKDTLLYLEGSRVYLENKRYDAIEEEYLYRNSLRVKTYFPEYGLFILNCNNSNQEFFKVEINDKIGLIAKNNADRLLDNKGYERFLMESFPIPLDENPVRMLPNSESQILDDFNDWTYIAVEIKGDWLRVRDNKDCIKGETASENDINGWIRWKKDGVFILKVGHVC